MSRDWMEVSRLDTVVTGDHASWMMSRHRDPSLKTFGWKTSVRKRTRGGLSGYVSGNVRRSEKTPPW